MTKRIDDGGPAFPHTETNATELAEVGMSLRDYFAAKALAGLLPQAYSSDHPEWFSGAAYKLADAMLAEREKGGPHD